MKSEYGQNMVLFFCGRGHIILSNDFTEDNEDRVSG